MDDSINWIPFARSLFFNVLDAASYLYSLSPTLFGLLVLLIYLVITLPFVQFHIGVLP